MRIPQKWGYMGGGYHIYINIYIYMVQRLQTPLVTTDTKAILIFWSARLHGIGSPSEQSFLASCLKCCVVRSKQATAACCLQVVNLPVPLFGIKICLTGPGNLLVDEFGFGTARVTFSCQFQQGVHSRNYQSPKTLKGHGHIWKTAKCDDSKTSLRIKNQELFCVFKSHLTDLTGSWQNRFEWFIWCFQVVFFISTKSPRGSQVGQVQDSLVTLLAVRHLPHFGWMIFCSCLDKHHSLTPQCTQQGASYIRPAMRLLWEVDFL